MTLLLAFLIGFFGGLRALTAPAATAWAAHLGWLKLERPLSLIGSLLSVGIFTVIALAELVADKAAADAQRVGAGRVKAAKFLWLDPISIDELDTIRDIIKKALASAGKGGDGLFETGAYQ